MSRESQNIFPRWANYAPAILLAFLIVAGGFATFVIGYWFSPKNLDVGYSPKQPIRYSHKLHVGQLGIDCRYCHTGVDKSANAGLPTSETCMKCHKTIKTDSPEIQKIAKSVETGKPIEWVKVHSLPDYSYFDHSRHINSGVSCYSCHGRVDQMERVHQVQPLSMGWCLDCHRAPQKYIRPKSEVTNMMYSVPDQMIVGKKLVKQYHIETKEDCSVCHR